jgi:hypothetical protein
MPDDTVTLMLTRDELMSICLCIEEAVESAENKTVKHLAPEVIPRYEALAEKLWEALGPSKPPDAADSQVSGAKDSPPPSD